MIFEYGFSVVGKSHIAKGTRCQDSHYIKKLKNGWVIAAVADGVGSAKNSHIGSEIAAQTVVDFCEECMPWDYNLISIKSMMRTAYNYAYKLILAEAEKSGEPVESYDTTLTTVIYDGQRVIYAHSGDGAIIGLTTFGDYVEITRPQKGADGISVIPLRAGYTQWDIDSYEEDLAAVILVTDGMLETICPYLLKDHDTKITYPYVALASFFADPRAIAEGDESKIRDAIKRFVTAEENYCIDEFYERLAAVLNSHLSEGVDEIIEKYKENNYPIFLMQKEQDDKTVVGLLNLDFPLDDKTAEFYSEPDWNALQEAWNRKAYPHMYASKDEAVSDNGASEDVDEVETATDTASDEKHNKEDQPDKVSGDDESTAVVVSANSLPSTTDADENDGCKPSSTSNGNNGSNGCGMSNASNAGNGNGTATPAAPPKHDRPRKKGLIGFFGDLFD